MDPNFLRHIEAMKTGALALAGEATKIIETTFKNAGEKEAKEFAAALQSSQALEMLQKAMNDIKDINNIRYE